MSCENTNARLQIKYTTIAGQEPTIPSTNDHNDGTWNPTDIYLGEFFLNAVDDKLWVRTIDGLLPMGGTGGSQSFIGDFVSKANGGTYSGPVFAPTFSAISMIANTISASAFDGIIFGSSASIYYGDGSNLTGITTNWDGGIVSLPSEFNNTVDFNQDISIGNVYPGTLGYIDIHSDVTVNGGLSASYFVGDGSLLTNLPMGPTANYYTTNSYLDGTTIRFDRTDLSNAYSVDLSPILFTQSVAGFDWNSSLNEATIFINDGSSFTINLNAFNDISTNIINATDVYASNFYGTFNGIFTDDIYTTGGTLVGTDLIFDRTNGSSYSVDLSALPSGGGTGSAGTLEQTLALGNDSGVYDIMMGTATTIGTHGGTGRLLLDSLGSGDSIKMDASQGSRYARVVVDGYGEVNFIGTDGTDTSDMFINEFGIQVSTSNGVGIEYTSDYSATFTNRSLVDKEYVDTHGGGAGATGLGGVLAIDNQTAGHNINLNEGDKIISDDGERIISMTSSKVFIQNEFLNPGDGIPFLEYGILDVNKGSTVTELKNYNENISSGSQSSGAVQVSSRFAAIVADNQTSSTNAFVKADLGTGIFPIAEVRLNATDGFSNISYMKVKPGTLEIGGSNNDGFQGLRYTSDYSLDYSNRSLVDKEYVDNAVSGSTLPLEQVLKNGNTTGTQSIYISSSASQIVGYNGIYQKWSDTSFPFNKNFKISNGTQSETKITIDGQNIDEPDSVRITLENGSMASTGQISRTTIFPESVRNYISDTDDTTYARNTDVNSTSYEALIETRWTDLATAETNSSFMRTDLYDPYNPNIYLQTTKNNATEGGHIKIEAGEINIHLEDQPQFLFSNTSFKRDQNIMSNYYTQVIPYVGTFNRKSNQETSVWQDGPDYARQISSSENVMMGWTVAASVESQTRGTSPTSGPDTAENILSVSNKLGYFSNIRQTSDTVIFNGFGNAAYMGAQYGGDYSALFVTHSLVDKYYVDNAVAGGGGASLTQVLAVGATANTYIEFERTKGIREIGGTGSYFTFLNNRSLWATGDGHLNSAGINLYKDGHVSIQSSNGIDGCELDIHDSGTFYYSGFSQDGIQYAGDYSPSYTNRSLVDKEYVDNAVAGGGGATPSLAQVLTTGNIASTDIDMNQNQIQNVSVIDADGNVGIQTINMINASLLTLMYNT